MTLPPPRLLRRLPLIVACLAAVAPHALRAQAEVRPGTRVRVLTSTADTRIKGTVVTLDSASLLIAPAPDAELVRIRLRDVEHLEVSRGGKPSTLAGAAIGAVAGAGTGLGAALLLGKDCGFVCGAVQVSSTVVGGALGLVWGALFGSSTPHGPERWRTVPLGAGP